METKRLPNKFGLIGTLAEGKRVLDVGCVGHGLDRARASRSPWLHGFLKERASRLVGVDVRRDDISKMQEEGFEVRCADAQTVDLGEPFELIVGSEIIEHVENPGLPKQENLKPLIPMPPESPCASVLSPVTAASS